MVSKNRIGIGFRIGKLEVVAPTEERKNGYTIWRCRCDCGGERLLDTRTLKRGSIRDCGCVTKVPPGATDLTGRRFGKLVAIAPTDQRKYGGGIVWRCLCDCDNVVYVSSHQLTSGYTKSCGCLSHPPLKDFIGKRFGQLMVIGYEGKQAGMHRWRCKCDCGNETVVGQTLLQTGKTKSCGCIQQKIIYDNLKLVDGTSVTILDSVKRRPNSSNTSGYTGVYLDKRTGKWIAHITFRRKKYNLGCYERIEDAVKARRKGEEMHEDFLNWYYQEYRKEGESHDGQGIAATQPTGTDGHYLPDEKERTEAASTIGTCRAEITGA